MSFGIKNAGATYQRLVNMVFKSSIEQTMEVYVDDMITKSKEPAEHIHHLKETFELLRRYKMKLNPKKCTFEVCSGKFLGFMVSYWGIEANPEKIGAITEMKSPQMMKEDQSLTGKLLAFNRFISRAINKCHAFFQAIRKEKKWSGQQSTTRDLSNEKVYYQSPIIVNTTGGWYVVLILIRIQMGY